jgi:hypothetical protein
LKRTKAESPTGCLGFFFGKTDGRRLVVAFAIAIALHEILAMVIPLTHEEVPPEKVVAVKLLIEKQPKPTPTPIVHMQRLVQQHVRPRVINPGVSAPKEAIKHAGAAAPKVKTIYHSKPIWDIVGAQGNGAGKKGTAGSLGNGGTGPGEGKSGNGPGAGPCGYVDFEDIHGSQYDKRTGGFFVDILMIVHYADGHSEDLQLDYPFYYPSETANPWSDRNKDNPDFITLFQFPPDNKRALEPPLVQYVMQHTDAEGYTTLNDCPE